MTQRHWGILVAAATLGVSALCTVAKPVRVTSVQEASAEKSPLDFQAYKTRVEPIFLKQRGEHARCYACHSQNASFFHLQKLSPGHTTWTEEQSKLNFESVSKLVTPGDTSDSKLLLHPLAPEGGGDSFHSGGRQFESQNDPDWRTIADWVRMAKPAP
jgi:hypothetical protein